MREVQQLIEKLEKTRTLELEEWVTVIENRGKGMEEFLFQKAQKIREKYFGNQIYTRGLIEFTNYCKNDCYYCGIRKSNDKISRYRLTQEEILSCCKEGYDLGFRTFVLQGGEDGYFTKERMVDLISAMRNLYVDCAITLSIGEQSYEEYKAYYDAGANRFLLRHETANVEHYGVLHPTSLSCENRKSCLWDLKRIGYQVGTGFMVGSPKQTAIHLAQDMKFIEELQPQMVGVGPFVPHHQTPFAKEQCGSSKLTIYMVALLRLMLPKALLPATTALGTADVNGREKAILAGANVVMPNLSPLQVRKKYELYDNKICTEDEAAECRMSLQESMEAIGCCLSNDRGDYIFE